MSGHGPSLLTLVQGLLSRTFDIRHGLGDLAPFVIGDDGYRKLYAANAAWTAERIATGCGQGAKTLVRHDGGRVHAAIYFPDPMIRLLENHPPQRGLSAVNLQPFATLVEEIDHLLLIAERCRWGRKVTLLELELHANVSKYLVAARFVAGNASRLSEDERLWLLSELFHRPRFVDNDRAVRERYRDAARYAVRFLEELRMREPASRLLRLRRFHDANTRTKVRMASALA